MPEKTEKKMILRSGNRWILGLLLVTSALVSCEPIETYCPLDWTRSEDHFQKISASFEIETLPLTVGISHTYLDLSYRITNRSNSTCEIQGLELAGVPPVNPARHSLEPGEQVTIDYAWSFSDRVLERFAEGFEVRFEAGDCALDDLSVRYELCEE